MIRLHAAGGNQRVCAVGFGARRDERKLPHFVSAEPERDRIVALDEQVWRSAESLRKSRHRLDE